MKSSYKKPLFDYISFCKHLNLRKIKELIDEEYGKKIFNNEILSLFINENREFTHLYLPHNFDNQIHLFPGAKHCFSELQFLHCYASVNENVLIGLTEICKSIKELELFIIRPRDKNYEIVRLIENQKGLFKIHLTYPLLKYNETFYEALENSSL